MSYTLNKEFLKPTVGKVFLTILFVLVLPNYAYWSCCLSPPCPVEYITHFGFEALLIQTGLVIVYCGELTYFYFWPLSILVAYLVSSALLNGYRCRIRRGFDGKSL